MKKTMTAIVVTAMIAAVPLAATTQSAQAGSKFWKGVGVGVGVGVGLGVVGALTRPRGTVIVQQPAPVVVHQAPAVVHAAPQFSQAHYNYCFSIAPNSYNPNTNTYVRRSGQVVTCYSGR